MFRINDLPRSEKPRERLLNSGPGALSATELLAIILGSGFNGKSVLELAAELLRERNLEKILFSAKYEELVRIKGIGNARACQLLACGELFKRLRLGNNDKSQKINSAIDAIALCEDIRRSGKEHLVGIYLNSRHRFIRREIISVGNMDSNIVDPKEIFRPALLCNAHSVILVHNHPSGEPEPSDEDIQITEVVEKAGLMLNLRLLDHIVLASGGFTSLCERGLLATKKSIN